MDRDPQKPLLSVIVPAYNRAGDLHTLLESLEGDLHRVEVIVIDDASPDAQGYDALMARFPAVRFVRQDRNRGPAAARNRGAREARCELLFFIDSDTAVVPGTLDAILRIYRNHPEFVVCCGTCDRRPLNRGLFPHYKALLETSWVMDRASGITTIGHIGSRAFTMRRSAMLGLSGFDENLPTADVEDYEFGYRVRAAHGPIPFSTRILVRHRYDGLWTQARLYFRRVILWWDLRAKSPGADEVGSTAGEATVAVLATLMSMLLLAAPIHPLFVGGAASAGAAAVALNRRFLGLCASERGVGFAAYAFGVHTVLSWFICAGGVVAIGRSILRRFRRRENVAFSRVRESAQAKASGSLCSTG